MSIDTGVGVSGCRDSVGIVSRSGVEVSSQGSTRAAAQQVQNESRSLLEDAKERARKEAERRDAIRSLHALAWSLDMPRAPLVGGALVDTPAAALAMCDPDTWPRTVHFSSQWINLHFSQVGFIAHCRARRPRDRTLFAFASTESSNMSKAATRPLDELDIDDPDLTDEELDALLAQMAEEEAAEHLGADDEDDEDGSSKTIKVAIIVRLFQKKLARDVLSTHDGPC